jgi:5'-nucleotidase
MTVRRSVMFALVLVAAACAAAPTPSAPAAQPAPARPDAPAPATNAAPAEVTFVHFSDMHEMIAGSAGQLGGIARVATVVQRERRSREAVLVTLGGDYLSPSALSTARVDGQALAGRQAVAALNLLRVDWATFGNHEFDLTEEAFRARLKETRFGLVSANVMDADGRDFAPAVPSVVTTVRAGGRDIRIGLVGLTIDFTIQPYVKYRPAVESARTQIAAMKGKIDAIVVLSHLGLPGDLDVAERIPEVDLVLGGHEHDNYVLRRGPGYTTVAKGDSNAKGVVIATLRFGPPGTRPSVSAQIERMDQRIAPDPAMLAEVTRWTDAAFAAFRRDGFDPHRVVATSPEPLDGRDSTVRVRSGNLTELISAALARDVKTVDVAILNGGSLRIDDVLMAGPITEYDILRMLPFGGKVLRAAVDGPLLIDILNAGVSNQGTGGFLHSRGAERKGGDWYVQGQSVDLKRRYTIAVPEYLLTGGERNLGFLTRTNPQVHDVQEFSDIRQAVMAEMRARHPSRAALASTQPAAAAVRGFTPPRLWPSADSLRPAPAR